MKKIIKYTLIKTFNIILPIFLIMVGICIGITPIITAMVVMKIWIFALLVVSIPLATAIISITNGFTDWDNIGEVNDIRIAIQEYQHNKMKYDNQ